MVCYDDQVNAYQCEVCSLHYEEREIAERCEAWCREHQSCNIEITRFSQEERVEGK